MTNAPVVVGVDGSPAGLDAVEVAAREARLRRRGLHIVHAFIWPALHVPLGPSPLGPAEGGLRNQAHAIVADAVRRAHAVAPDIEVTNAIVTGEPLTVLEAQSRHVPLVVVGSRGLGSFLGLLLGSTAVHLAAHSHCPVLVARGGVRTGGDIVLGVDGSPEGEAAVGFAFAEASLHGARLVALHAWSTWNTWPDRDVRDPGDPPIVSFDKARLRAAEERVLSEVLSGWKATYPDVVVERRLVEERTRPALIEASRSARLTVVGARGRGGFSGLLMGSVSQALLHHAYGPVAVVRGPHGTAA
ncbi:universal stress protein [Streptomyces sp. NPDC047928]|uniref:universal stress protein n=1 Tax=unclassified Streptomyces TaxID=2593676 RepID=UPI0037117524